MQHFAATPSFYEKDPVWFNSECPTIPVYQLWKKLIHNFWSYTICCKWYYFAAFCSNLMIFVKETILNQFRIPSYPSIPSLETINVSLSELCHLLSFQALYLKKLLQLLQQQQQQNNFDWINLFLLSNKEKSVNFRKKIWVV